MISYGISPTLGPCMTITMPVGGPCEIHDHPGGGPCPGCIAEIQRFNEECRRAFPPSLPTYPIPAAIWPPPVPGVTGPWVPPIQYVGTPMPGQCAEITCGPARDL
jgi:hypothetical protein